MAEDRLQKILARAGYGSRRASEELITAGRVKINGNVAVLGSKADPQHDAITVDNQLIAKEQAPAYVALNKPQGVLSEVSSGEPRQTVRDLVPLPGHLFIVGRLDMESEGLILLTNDGELANRLTHPRYGHEKEYRVLVGTRPDERQMDALRHGVVLEDGYRTQPAQVRLEGIAGRGAWLRVILREGRKRQIREMGKQIGVPVLRIQRIRIGTLLIGELKPGEWRQLRPEEIRALKVNKTYREEARTTRRPLRNVTRREPRGEGRSETPPARRGEAPREGTGARPQRPGVPRRSRPGEAPNAGTGTRPQRPDTPRRSRPGTAGTTRRAPRKKP